MSFKAFLIIVVMCFFLFCVGFNSAMAQNFNVDFGTTCGTPANNYEAAGRAGVWNGLSSLGVSPLTDISGVATPVTVNVTATSYSSACGDCSPPINALIGDFFSTNVGTWTVVFNNLADGDYTVIIYAPSPELIPTGVMNVNGTSVPVIWGNICNFILGTSHVIVPVTVTGGTLTITGASSAAALGLSGIQLQTRSASSVPTMTERGMIIFVILAGLGAVYFMRRKRRANS